MSVIINENKINAVFQKYYPLLLNVAAKKTGNIHDAEDICQEVFIVFWKKAIVPDNTKNWLLGILQKTISVYMRKKRRESDPLVEIDDNCPLSRTYCETHDLVIMLEDIYDQHDGIKKHVHILKSVHKWTYKKIARELNMKIWNVRYMYNQFIHSLRSHFRTMGFFTVEDVLC